MLSDSIRYDSDGFGTVKSFREKQWGIAVVPQIVRGAGPVCKPTALRMHKDGRALFPSGRQVAVLLEFLPSGVVVSHRERLLSSRPNSWLAGW